jgi:D-glycero-D-manno-heptose 1,7-bisphosphate phosphatase
MERIIILDRDGVINQDSDEYIKSPSEWQAIPESLDAIAQLNQANYKVVIATNQSGLARGLFDIDTLNAIHNKMLRELKAVNGKIEKIFFCPHAPNDNCLCRKPKSGLFEQIATYFNTKLNAIPAIGDSLRDLQAAHSIQAQAILVRTGKGLRTIDSINKIPVDSWEHKVPIYKDLATVVKYIL